MKIITCFLFILIFSLEISCAQTNPSKDFPLQFDKPVEHLGSLAREPMVVQHPNGTLFLSGYGSSTPVLWSSQNQGKTWQQIAIGSEGDGAIGNSDVDLAIGPKGTLYFVVMTYDRQKNWGLGISVGTSQNVGKDWNWTRISEDKFDDRPWIEVAPNGTAHVIWNDGQGVCHALSKDQGKTWQENERIYDKGGSSHLAIGPKGEIAVRISPLCASGNTFHEGEDHLSISTDGGQTWELKTLPGTRKWAPITEGIDRWVEPLAWDEQGNLYYLWGEEQSLWLGRSSDQGKTWSKWMISENEKGLFYPYLVPHKSGALGATWFSERADLKAHAAYITFENADQPQVYQVPAFQFDCYWGQGRDTGGEYLPIIFLEDGRMAIVTPIQHKKEDHYGFTWRPLQLP